jgi:hypothetical protein
VNIGSRQAGRQRGRNVIDVAPVRAEISAAIATQVSRKRYDMEPIYGDGKAGARIADVLARVQVDAQKRITY